VIDALVVGPKADISGLKTGSSFRRRWRPAMFPIAMTGAVTRALDKAIQALG
jgi:hypothetical protein